LEGGKLKLHILGKVDVRKLKFFFLPYTNWARFKNAEPFLGRAKTSEYVLEKVHLCNGLHTTPSQA